MKPAAGYSFEELLEETGIPVALPQAPIIYCWVNSGKGTDWQVGLAMADPIRSC